jgi:hypothetical protein
LRWVKTSQIGVSAAKVRGIQIFFGVRVFCGEIVDTICTMGVVAIGKGCIYIRISECVC